MHPSRAGQLLHCQVCDRTDLVPTPPGEAIPGRGDQPIKLGVSSAWAERVYLTHPEWHYRVIELERDPALGARKALVCPGCQSTLVKASAAARAGVLG